MKLNKKGISLIELLISIVLIAVVMMFMFRLLIDVTNAQNNDTYAKDNQVNRTEILKKIQSDFIDKKLVSVSDISSSSEQLILDFTFQDASLSRLIATQDTISYGASVSGSYDMQKWTIEGGKVKIGSVKVYCQDDGKTTDSISAVTIDLEIHTNNEQNNDEQNNVLDDIILSFVGNTDLCHEIPPCLGNDC